MVRSLEQITMLKVYLASALAALTFFFCFISTASMSACRADDEQGNRPRRRRSTAWSAGAFFWGYVLFEVPSNSIL